MVAPVAFAQTTDDMIIVNMTAEEALVALAEGQAATDGGGTPDGLTPAVEDICTKWGFDGKVNGLCNAYCEAMDCDDPNPHASDQACTRVLDKIQRELGDTPFPTCEDSDDDGVPNGGDNCPAVANLDQTDGDGDGVGDACDNCPSDENPAQEDENMDGIGDACEVTTPESICPCNEVNLRNEGVVDPRLLIWNADFPMTSGLGTRFFTIVYNQRGADFRDRDELFADPYRTCIVTSNIPGQPTVKVDKRDLTRDQALACRAELADILYAPAP
jgi:hypothetical protein